jgi:hypothetical protein
MINILKLDLKKAGEFYIFRTEFTNVSNIIEIPIIHKDQKDIWKIFWRWGYKDEDMSFFKELDKSAFDIIFDNKKKLLLEIKIVILKDTKYDLPDLTIKFKNSPITPIWELKNVGIDESLFTISETNFNPYLGLQLLFKTIFQLSNSVGHIYGHDVEFFRMNPYRNMGDIVFREWTLSKLDDPKCIKIIVPNNEFPDGKLKYSEFGIDYEAPFEVNILRQEFEKKFGVGSAPQKGDVIFFYWNLRLYEVDSAYIDDVNQFYYFKVSLIKYQPKYNREENEDLINLLEENANSFEKLFSENVIYEEKDNLIEQQYKPTIGSLDNNALDPSRNRLYGDLIVVNNKISAGKSILFQNYYDLRVSKLENNDNGVLLEYNDMNNQVRNSNNRSITFWIKSLEYKIEEPSEPLKDIFFINKNGGFSIKKVRDWEIDDYLCFSRLDKELFIAKIVQKEKIADNYYYKFDFVCGDHREDLSGWTVKKSYPETIFTNGVTGILKYSTNIFEFYNRGDKKIFRLPNNEWYGIIINILETHKQVSINIFQRSNNLIKNLGQIIFDIMDFVPNDKYWLHKSSVLIANIKVYDKIVNEDQMNKILTEETIVENGRHLILLDNAKPLLNIPFIANSK